MEVVGREVLDVVGLLGAVVVGCLGEGAGGDGLPLGRGTQVERRELVGGHERVEVLAHVASGGLDD